MGIPVKTLAYSGASEKQHIDAMENLNQMFGPHLHAADEEIQILYFLSGGSEAEAIKKLDSKTFQLLIAAGQSNAFASATEVKAYSNAHGYNTELLFLDEPVDRQRFEKYLSVLGALERIKGKRLGLIGEISDWLVASDIDGGLLKNKLGIELQTIPWKDVGDFTEYMADPSFLECYHAPRQYKLEDAGKVNSMLKAVIDKYKLDAITVECFSLVQQKEVTACLSLSFLNDIGIPAGCEGDLCSITGMMIVNELCGELPWMANIAGIRANDVLLAHCTAPTNVLSEHHINTHFETGKGTAIHGRHKSRDVTIFRINDKLDKLFFAHGNVVDGRYDKHACRTQMHVEFSEEIIEELKTNPLGNHHLVIPGDQTYELGLLSNILQ